MNLDSDQTLEEGELGSQKECQVEDSGTESDDETDKEEGDDIESEEGDLNLDSGVSLNLRSGADRAHRGRSRQLPTLARLGSSTGQTSLPAWRAVWTTMTTTAARRSWRTSSGAPGRRR